MKRLSASLLCFALAAVSLCGAAAVSPLSPEQERASFQLADSNLVVELVAAEPDVRAPVAVAWNGDGVADVREKILTGFAEGNQQLRVNGLFWGIDNWIYGCNGRSDGEVKWADGAPAGSIRRHDFRFRLDMKQFEAIAGNSQFGM